MRRTKPLRRDTPAAREFVERSRRNNPLGRGYAKDVGADVGEKKVRHSSLRRGKRRRLSPEQRDEAAAFHASAVGFCRACDMLLATEVHHVVEAQLLRRARPELVYDVRNALPLDTGCHMRHTSGFRRLKRSVLTAQNEEFAREVLGDAADDYLSRRYQ